MRSGKGFTLIELLVVISIIALLSSIVLASLQSAREKARAASVRQGTLELVKSLELHHSTYGTYNGYLQAGGYFFDQASDCKDGVVAYDNMEFTSTEGANICKSLLVNLPADQPAGQVGDMMMVINADSYFVSVKLVDGVQNHNAAIWFCAHASGVRKSNITYAAATTCSP